MLTPENLTDIFDNAVNKSHHVNQRFARVDAMRAVLTALRDEHKQVWQQSAIATRMFNELLEPPR